MALCKSITTVYGITVAETYLRVENLVVKKDAINFQLKGYVSTENPNFYSADFVCSYNIDGENPIKQAYEHLKTLSNFAGAVNC